MRNQNFSTDHPCFFKRNRMRVSRKNHFFCDTEVSRIDPNSSDLASLFIRRERWHVTRFPTSHGIRGTFSGLGTRVSSLFPLSVLLLLTGREARKSGEMFIPSLARSALVDHSQTGVAFARIRTPRQRRCQRRINRAQVVVCCWWWWCSTFLFESSLTHRGPLSRWHYQLA